MFEYIKANLNYPALASENGIDGTSMVSFIVLSNGDLTRIKTIRSAGWNMDEEAIRIIKSMPKWKPGKMDGIPVNVRISIPVKFRIKQD
jgi:protein TonB